MDTVCNIIFPYFNNRNQHIVATVPVIILDTVRVVVVIGDKGRPLKYTGAGAAAETVSMEALAHCFENTVCDPLPTSGTHCQGALRQRRRNVR